MPVDASIYGAMGVRPKSIADFDQENQQSQLNMLNLQSLRAKADSDVADRNMLAQFRGAFKGNADQNSPEFQNQLYAADPTRAAAFMDARQKSLTAAALAHKDNSVANQNDYDLHRMMVTHGLQSALASATPEQAQQAVADGVKHGYWSMQDAQEKISKIPTDPAQYSQWRLSQLSSLVSAKDQLDASKPVNGTRNTGNTIENTATDPFSGAVRVTATTPLQATPGEVLQSNTSRANNRDTIAAENARAGVGATGELDANAERTAQGIANGQLPAPAGMALLNPKNQRILGRVMEINPQYDATTVSAKKAAATAFTTGVQGTQLNKFATTGEHLDQLLPLIDALHNGNNQTVNAIGNAVSKWNGGTAVTNFDAVKAVATKEMMAALVAGGGDAQERKELSDSLKGANAPKQLQEVVQAYRGLMGAKEDNLMEQRRAAGLPDSTLPHYHKGGAPTAPAAVPAANPLFKLTHVDGKPV